LLAVAGGLCSSMGATFQEPSAQRTIAVSRRRATSAHLW
jgi:hypothetical protein